MKNLIVICFILFCSVMVAQPQKGHRGKPGKERAEKMKNMTPEQHAELATLKMALNLDLTDAQRTQIKALNLETAKKRHEKRANRDKKKELSSEELYNLQKQRLEDQLATAKKLKSILNDEQFEKHQKSHKMRKRKMRQKRHTRKR